MSLLLSLFENNVINHSIPVKTRKKGTTQGILYYILHNALKDKGIRKRSEKKQERGVMLDGKASH